MGVAVLEDDVVAEVRPDAVVFADGAVRPSAVTIWTAGFGVPELAADSGLRTDALGRLLTDETLTSVDDSRIVAAGDCAAPSGQPLRMSCQAAGPLGAQAANTVLSRIAGEEPAVVDQAFAGSCVSLGRRGAVLQLAHKDDSPVNFYIGGRMAASVKEAVCKGTLWGLRHARRASRARCSTSRAATVREPSSSRSPASRRWSRNRDHQQRSDAGSTGDEHAERFTHLRPLLFTIVYEILGSATESDDVLQDSYLRWAEVDLATVRDTKSYLAQLVTRQALNALRASARRREDYVGPWLPEPLLLDERDASSDVVLAESVSMAMLVLLETLTPDERAVFVLREVFGFDYDEIAGAVGKSVDAVRQVAHRAREHVQARRKRFEPVDVGQTARDHRAVLHRGNDRRHGGPALAARPGRHVDRGQRRQGQRRPPAGGRRAEGGVGAHRPVPDWAGAHAGAAVRDRGVQQRARDGRLQRRPPGGRLSGRDHRRQDHPLLRDAQSGQADRDRGPAEDHPLAFCHAYPVRIDRLGDLGSAPAVLRAVADAAARRGLAPPAALIGEWFGSGAVIAPSLTAGAVGVDEVFDVPSGAADAGAVGGGWFGYLSYPDAGADGRPPRLPEAAGGWTDCVLRQDSDGQWWYESLSGAPLSTWVADAVRNPVPPRRFDIDLGRRRPGRPPAGCARVPGRDRGG